MYRRRRTYRRSTANPYFRRYKGRGAYSVGKGKRAYSKKTVYKRKARVAVRKSPSIKSATWGSRIGSAVKTAAKAAVIAGAGLGAYYLAKKYGLSMKDLPALPTTSETWVPVETKRSLPRVPLPVALPVSGGTPGMAMVAMPELPGFKRSFFSGGGMPFRPFPKRGSPFRR